MKRNNVHATCNILFNVNLIGNMSVPSKAKHLVKDALEKKFATTS